MAARIDDELRGTLVRMGLLGADEWPETTELQGGVSSDIVRVATARGPVCVKRALPRLKVPAKWEAPVTRNAAEAEWMRVAAGIVPDAVPELLAVDAKAGLFAMAFLSPDDYPLWKTQLRDGTIEPATAASIGAVLAAIHGTTADDPDLSARFANDATFHAIRIEPYLLAAAEAHPDRGAALRRLAETTATTRRALVHGDVSPKNILIGPRGPVLLDAECAWFGDPAFDLAFCLNHLLLKGEWRPRWRRRYLACFEALHTTYLDRVGWEPRAAVECRAARLLPGLLLARVDGKSPVEYITDDHAKNRIRSLARAWVANPVDRLAEVADGWRDAGMP